MSQIPKSSEWFLEVGWVIVGGFNGKVVLMVQIQNIKLFSLKPKIGFMDFKRRLMIERDYVILVKNSFGSCVKLAVFKSGSTQLFTLTD